MPEETEEQEGITRDKFEKALLERFNDKHGWKGMFAGIALAGMFVSRSISDLSLSVKGLAATAAASNRRKR